MIYTGLNQLGWCILDLDFIIAYSPLNKAKTMMLAPKNVLTYIILSNREKMHMTLLKKKKIMMVLLRYST